MRLTFGNPDVTTFDMWGFWANDMWSQAPYAALFDANFNLTTPGTQFVNLMSQWTTDVTLPVDANGNIDFTGFYGDYDVTICRSNLPLIVRQRHIRVFTGCPHR